jgi:hypothetical protein
VIVNVNVAVIVIDPLIVAALVSGNDAVEVIDTVDEDATGRSEQPIARACSTPRSSMYTGADRIARLGTPWRCWRADRSLIVQGIDHLHGVVPAHERGHDQGVDHDHDHDHDHGHTDQRLTIMLPSGALFR